MFDRDFGTVWIVCTFCLLFGHMGLGRAQTKDIQDGVKRRLELQALKTENANLRKKVKELEKQIQSLEQLVKERNDQLKHALYLSQMQQAARLYQKVPLSKKPLDRLPETKPKPEIAKPKKRKSLRRNQKMKGRLDTIEANQESILKELQELKKLLQQQSEQRRKQSMTPRRETALPRKPHFSSRVVHEEKKLQQCFVALTRAIIQQQSEAGVRARNQHRLNEEGRFDGNVIETAIGKEGHVRMNLGSRHGLAIGQILFVLRKGPPARYLGEVKVIEVTPRTALGEIVPSKFMRARPEINVGAMVTNDLEP
ncbi:MAG: hypothetical protein ACFCD0_29710 [Gemmataceae bacterium]